MKSLLVLCGILISSFAMSQTWDEWFRQKQTKLKYIEQQIAAFEVYGSYLKKGYDIVEKGWNVVNDIKHGDFDLHSDYLNSLKQVNTVVSNYDRVDGIINLQMEILEVNNKIKRLIQNNENVEPEESAYAEHVLSNFLTTCTDDLDALGALTTNDSLKMKDDERLQRIDNIYVDMQDKNAFIKSFQSALQTLALARSKEKNDISTAKLLYGIK